MLQASSTVKEFASLGKTKSAYESMNSTASHIYSMDCPVIDIYHGGGLFSGKILEIMAWESQGKSTLALEYAFSFIEYWQNKNHQQYLVLWIETESALDKARVEMMAPGKLKHFSVAEECECVEDVHTLVRAYLDKALVTGTKLFIVWDTLAAASTHAEKAAKGTNRYAGGQGEKPQLIRYMLRDIVSDLGKTDSILILVNQLQQSRDNTADESLGGGAVKFFSSIRTRMRKTADINKILPDGTELKEGIYTKLTPVKSKLGLKQDVIIKIYGETGIDKLGTTLAFLKEKKLIEVKGAGWATIVYPDKVWKKDNKVVPFTPEMDAKGNLHPDCGWTSFKFQQEQKVKDHIEAVHPHLKEWMSYLVYENFSFSSPLTKVKIIDKIWEYETLFFGRRKTVLSDKEIEVAKTIHEKLEYELKQQEVDLAHHA